jgi:hypothetical protein
VFPEIKSRDNPPTAVQIPAVPNNAVLGVPVVVPAVALDVAAEAPAIPMEIEEPEVVEVVHKIGCIANRIEDPTR